MEDEAIADISDLLVVAEIAQQYRVSQRTVDRWIERGLAAQKAADEQLLQLLQHKRIKRVTPQRHLAHPSLRSQPDRAGP